MKAHQLLRYEKYTHITSLIRAIHIPRQKDVVRLRFSRDLRQKIAHYQ